MPIKEDGGFLEVQRQLQLQCGINETITFQTDVPLPYSHFRYFKLEENRYCSFLNTDIPRSLIYRRCMCRNGFFDTDCGIPHFFWSQLLHNGTIPMELVRVDQPRRVIEFKFHGINSSDGSIQLVDNLSNVTQTQIASVQNSTVCYNASLANSSSSSGRSGLQHELPDLQVYSGPKQSNFTCALPQIAAFSCPTLLCCWNQFWMQASELSFNDLVVLDIGEPSTGPSLPGELLDFLKFYRGFGKVLMIRRGPSVSIVATFNSVAVECNFDIKCIASCESSKLQVINLDL